MALQLLDGAIIWGADKNFQQIDLVQREISLFHNPLFFRGELLRMQDRTYWKWLMLEVLSSWRQGGDVSIL